MILRFSFWTMIKSRFLCVCISVAVSFWIVTYFSFRHLDFKKNIKLILTSEKKEKSMIHASYDIFFMSINVRNREPFFIFFYLHFGNTVRFPDIDFLLKTEESHLLIFVYIIFHQKNLFIINNFHLILILLTLFNITLLIAKSVRIVKNRFHCHQSSRKIYSYYFSSEKEIEGFDGSNRKKIGIRLYSIIMYTYIS